MVQYSHIFSILHCLYWEALQIGNFRMNEGMWKSWETLKQQQHQNNTKKTKTTTENKTKQTYPLYQHIQS